MELALFLLLLFAVAVLAGFIGSLAGLGGGVVIMPILVIYFQVPFVEAVGASAVSVLATSITAGSVYVRNHMTDIRIGMFLEIATVPGAFLGIALTLLLAKSNLEPVLLVLLGIMLLSTLPANLRKWGEEVPTGVVQDESSKRFHLEGAYFDEHLQRRVEYRAADTRSALDTMFAAGIVSGMFGIGSGVLKVVALERYLRLPVKIATSTSNFMIGVTVAASTSVLLVSGYINPALAAPVAMGTALGSWGGSRVFPSLSNHLVRAIFIPVLIVLAVEVILRGVGVL
jgi:hypothetical protein